MRREANFQSTFRHWLMANPMVSGAFELKQTTTSSLPFDDVQTHQLRALLAVKYAQAGLLYKAPDDSIGTKPFDFLYLRKELAWIVIKYPSGFVIIDVDTFMLEKGRSKRKSLTWERAQDISFITVLK